MNKIAIKLNANSHYSSERPICKSYIYSILNKKNLKNLSINQLFFSLGPGLTSIGKSPSGSSSSTYRFVIFNCEIEKEAIGIEISKRLPELDILFYEKNHVIKQDIKVFRNGEFQYKETNSLCAVSKKLTEMRGKFDDSTPGILDFSIRNELENPNIERMRLIDYWVNEIGASNFIDPSISQKALDAGLPFELCAHAIKNPQILKIKKVFPSTFERFYDEHAITPTRKSIIDSLYNRALIENEILGVIPKTKARLII